MTEAEPSRPGGDQADETASLGRPGSPGAGTWDRRHLRIYLGDHRGGASGGVALARRMAERERGTPLGDAVREVAGDIAADVATLDAVIEHFGVHPSRLKQAAGTVAERVGRLKLNGRLRGTSPLSRLLELEMLLAGIDAKHSLWCALRASDADGALAAVGVDLDLLARRALDQRERLVPFHRDAARWSLVDRMAMPAAPATGESRS